MSWFDDAVSAVGDAFSQAGDAIAGAFVAPLGDIFHGLSDLFTAIGDLIKGDPQGADREVGLAFHDFESVASDAAMGTIGAGIMLGGIAISGIQRVIGIEKPTPRPLWKDELEVLQQIFVNSIDYDAISILEGDLGLLGLADSVFTLGHRIYVSQGSGFVSLRQNKSVLVHEATHIWQFQNGGPDYVSEALIAQTWGDGGGRCLVGEPGAVPPPYPQPAPRGYGFEQDVKAGVTWENLNPEQQATFIETGFQVGFNFQDPAAGVMDPFGDYPAYADYMREALRLIRGGDGTPNNPL